MKHLADIQIPRYLSEDATAKRALLIGFCDASQRAYAAVIYLRTELVTRKVHVSMITSKTRVAPVKSITLLRLELLAALLLSELYVIVLESSQENPADCASRGIAASKIKVHKLWWSGPQWLRQDSLHFPSIDLSTSCEEDVKCEDKSSIVLTNVSTSS
ncbi:g-protein coupled receptor moody [Trichonephila clavipes]|nr:g-protein coupled receptor moody [Trichonephila clavipes]